MSIPLYKFAEVNSSNLLAFFASYFVQFSRIKIMMATKLSSEKTKL